MVRLSSFCALLYRNPEVLLWERFWVERNKALDRELYGIVKFCDQRLEFGLNVWNRNHLNPWRKAQWPWDEQTQWADWVKPIVYQHQTGGVFTDEWSLLMSGVLRQPRPECRERAREVCSRPARRIVGRADAVRV